MRHSNFAGLEAAHLLVGIGSRPLALITEADIGAVRKSMRALAAFGSFETVLTPAEKTVKSATPAGTDEVGSDYR